MYHPLSALILFRHSSEMKLLKIYISIQLYLGGSRCWALNFKQLGSVKPIRELTSLSSSPNTRVTPRKVAHGNDSRIFNHRGDWGRIAELTDAIYADPKNISNWSERAQLYKESDLPFHAFSDHRSMVAWVGEEELDKWQV